MYDHTSLRPGCCTADTNAQPPSRSRAAPRHRRSRLASCSPREATAETQARHHQPTSRHEGLPLLNGCLRAASLLAHNPSQASQATHTPAPCAPAVAPLAQALSNSARRVLWARTISARRPVGSGPQHLCRDEAGHTTPHDTSTEPRDEEHGKTHVHMRMPVYALGDDSGRLLDPAPRQCSDPIGVGAEV
jgi:hypothetical protein